MINKYFSYKFEQFMAKGIQFLLLLVLLFGSQPSFTQSFTANFRHLTVDDGLQGRRVNSIVEDNEGFIWLATNEGLSRFDGYEFKHFTKEKNGLNSNKIIEIAIDKKGLLWLKFLNNIYKENYIQAMSTTNYQLFDVNEIVTASPSLDIDWKLFSILADGEIFLRDKKRNHFKVVDNDLEPFLFKTKKYWEGENHYWQIEESSIKKYDRTGKLIEAVDFLDYRLTDITILGKYLFVQAYSKKNRTKVLIQKSLKGESITIIPSTNNQSSLLAKGAIFYNESLYIAHQDTFVTVSTKSHLTKKPGLLFLDKRGNVWVGGGNGVFIVSIKLNNFNIYLKNALGENELYDSRGIWANQDYLYSFSDKKAFRWHFSTQQKEPLTAYFKDLRTVATNTQNELWGGGHGFYIAQTDVETGLPIQKKSREKINVLWSLFRDKKMNWWGGTLGVGMLYYNVDTSTQLSLLKDYQGFDFLKKSQIVHFSEDKKDDNFFWISANSGWYLAHVDKGIIERYSSESELGKQIPSSDIYYTYQDKDGIYWLGTASSGLLRVELTKKYEVKTVQQFTMKDGFSSNTIYGIFEDENNTLWMSSNNGIIKLDKETTDVQYFLMEDGLSHYEFNRGSAFQREDGEIFFGTLNGIVSFQPKDFAESTEYDAPLKISYCEQYLQKRERIWDATHEVLERGLIILEPNDRFFTLSVSLQDYFDAPRLRYSYKIIGFHNDYQITKSNKISISGLPYGRYRLHIRGIGKDGRYSNQEITLPIIVKRPFYLRRWFILLSIIVLIISIFQWLKWRTRTIELRRKELEVIVKERTTQLEKQTKILQADKETIEEQAEELRSLDKMKSRFFANISHELRTPLTLILSPNKRMMSSQKLDNQNYTLAALVQQNAKKLLKRINEILDLTKLEAQKVELQPIPTQFYTFTKRLASTFESLAQEKEQSLTFKYLLDKNLQVLLDQDKFEHIFNNYLSNAIRYTPKGGKIEIKISEKAIVSTNPKEETYFVLAINDTGQGILPQDLPKIFDRFYQTKETKNKINSSGIGLALTREIALLMKGEVGVKSEIGKGSTFYFEMPYTEYLGVVEESKLKETEPLLLANLSQIKESSEAEQLPLNGKPNILLVEDNSELRNYIELILSKKYNVITAENGQEALEQLAVDSKQLNNSEALPAATANCQLIISDIMMPVMDGFELLEKVKGNDKWRHIPVIMLTARTNIKAKLQALRIGVDDYLLKPFDDEELMARIDNLLENLSNRQPLDANENTSEEENSALIVSEADTKWLKEVELLLQGELANTNYNINDLSIALNRSRSYTHRRIKEITGLPPNKYFREIKLQAAREILELGKVQTVSEVAYAVGFDTPKYFSKLYAARFGKRPIEYFKS